MVEAFKGESTGTFHEYTLFAYCVTLPSTIGSQGIRLCIYHPSLFPVPLHWVQGMFTLIIIIGVPKGLGLLSRLPLPLQNQHGIGLGVAWLVMFRVCLFWYHGGLDLVAALVVLAMKAKT